jgi:hypothetical protein
MNPELSAFSALVDQLGRDWANYNSRLDSAAKQLNSQGGRVAQKAPAGNHGL